MLHNFKWFGRILEVREDRGYVDHLNYPSTNKTVIGHPPDQTTYQHRLNTNNKINEKHYIQMDRKINTNKMMVKQGVRF